jgi:hypothetical protein
MDVSAGTSAERAGGDGDATLEEKNSTPPKTAAAIPPTQQIRSTYFHKRLLSCCAARTSFATPTFICVLPGLLLLICVGPVMW